MVDAVEELLGARFQIIVAGVQPVGLAPPLEGSVGVLLARADDARPAALLLEVERSLAAAVAARAVKRPPPILVGASEPSPALAGAFAAVALAVGRRAHAGVALRVAGAGPTERLDGVLTRSASELVSVSLTVLLGDDAYAARVVFSREAVQDTGAPDWNAARLRGLGATPLSIPLVASAWSAPAGELFSLRRGDALVPNRWGLARTDAGGLAGALWLAPVEWQEGIRTELGEGGRLVLRGDLESLCGPEAEMDEKGDDTALVSAIGDLPVVVRVEIGEATMPARAWAELASGDVIALGRRVGERVLVRVGGVALARGELVDIEGEIGVRIVERIADRGTSR